MTTQDDLEFHRDTGIERSSKEVLCEIDSTEPLPADIHEIMLGLDHRYRFSTDPDRNRLTEDEKRALKFIARFPHSFRRMLTLDLRSRSCSLSYAKAVGVLFNSVRQSGVGGTWLRRLR